LKDESAPPLVIESEVFTFGRLPDSGLVLTDALVSRKHAEIRRAGGAYRIVDLNSLNGVYVNNLKITDEQLAHGDVIAIGEARILFEDPPDPVVMKAGPATPTGPQKAKTPAPPPAPMMQVNIPGLSEREIIKPLQKLDPQYDLEVVSFSGAGVPGRNIVVPPKIEPARSRNFFILYQVARALNSINSLSELLDLTMTLILQVINAERGVIFLYNDQGELEPVLTRSKKGGDMPELTVSKTITMKAIEQNSAIITADACYDPRFNEGVSIITYNIRSALCVPLWDRAKTRGAIYLDNVLQTYAFSEDDLDLMTAIANQVAIAVQHEEMQANMQEAAVFRANLERFHSPDVVNHIMQQSKDEAPFGRFLSEREVTILFADICDFTPLLERMAPQDAASLLIDYFDAMTEIIFKYKGTVDKFIGDAIMAIFGAPISHGNDAELAIYSAIEMIREMDRFRAAHSRAQAFDIRIGINTGIVAAGYLGSKKRVEYTVLGDPVNVAARLQGVAAPGSIIVGEATYDRVSGRFKFTDRGLTRLKGKKQETRVYEVQFQ
ncbi:MAG TPA: adenylate/guanylate cyclase domain-containing protein, partial [bacterium]|nr:adenylate/guanylate cyclase domain-containing protein [bacterium]